MEERERKEERNKKRMKKENGKPHMYDKTKIFGSNNYIVNIVPTGVDAGDRRASPPPLKRKKERQKKKKKKGGGGKKMKRSDVLC